MTIVEFLEARIAEDETAAREALPEQDNVYGAGGFFEPSRVLAECAAKRAIIELHTPIRDDGWKSGEANDYLWCGTCGSIDDSPEPYPCMTIKALAAIYAIHPDFQQEWAV
jgi:hypothetical protein